MTLYTLADIPKLAGKSGLVENRAHHFQICQLNASWSGRSANSRDSRGTELMNGLTIQRKAMGTVRLRLMDSHSTMTLRELVGTSSRNSGAT